ncbi:hypothetical protein GLOTRDRAFT_138840 [Gloeophyllum trabeum ATCC 11539]|uniref:Uncharacterized protein n=1 Tax=Gloeophyllum trabeum (strain ATCC 11539 / FP-39264 / Madison 617) TaxID=670483 RepID=S7RQN7_GLOTA|nr:uncharacterized protein GLOTRDRAFT_138840 [Gloeophyllum trabeum ATCC 11539]EPQ55219.1 hypothetical protein GLOTRDRAFT_138840 [Gloeophyllum trabeum ATCC 11539]
MQSYTQSQSQFQARAGADLIELELGGAGSNPVNENENAGAGAEEKEAGDSEENEAPVVSIAGVEVKDEEPAAGSEEPSTPTGLGGDDAGRQDGGEKAKSEEVAGGDGDAKVQEPTATEPELGAAPSQAVPSPQSSGASEEQRQDDPADDKDDGKQSADQSFATASEQAEHKPDSLLVPGTQEENATDGEASDATAAEFEDWESTTEGPLGEDQVLDEPEAAPEAKDQSGPSEPAIAASGEDENKAQSNPLGDAEGQTSEPMAAAVDVRQGEDEDKTQSRPSDVPEILISTAESPTTTPEASGDNVDATVPTGNTPTAEVPTPEASTTTEVETTAVDKPEETQDQEVVEPSAEKVLPATPMENMSEAKVEEGGESGLGDETLLDVDAEPSAAAKSPEATSPSADASLAAATADAPATPNPDGQPETPSAVVPAQASKETQGDSAALPSQQASPENQEAQSSSSGTPVGNIAEAASDDLVASVDVKQTEDRLDAEALVCSGATPTAETPVETAGEGAPEVVGEAAEDDQVNGEEEAQNEGAEKEEGTKPEESVNALEERPPPSLKGNALKKWKKKQRDRAAALTYAADDSRPASRAEPQTPGGGDDDEQGCGNYKQDEATKQPQESGGGAIDEQPQAARKELKAWKKQREDKKGQAATPNDTITSPGPSKGEKPPSNLKGKELKQWHEEREQQHKPAKDGKGAQDDPKGNTDIKSWIKGQRNKKSGRP